MFQGDRTRLLARLTLVLVTGTCIAACHAPRTTLRLATTTSVESSGLLDALRPALEAELAIVLDVLPVGSGRALALVDRGDADAAITHDPEAERRALASGYVHLYRKIMYNDFLIVGPPTDPAGVRHAADAVDAMRRIAASSTPFVSRGDSSGTHARERDLWQEAGTRPAPARLLESGQGMAPTLRIAAERSAYCLTDRATYTQLAASLALSLVHEGDRRLTNTYAFMIGTELPTVQARHASDVRAWLSDGHGREVIGAFRVGEAQVFGVWPLGAPRDHPGDRPDAR